MIELLPELGPRENTTHLGIYDFNVKNHYKQKNTKSSTKHDKVPAV